MHCTSPAEYGSQKEALDAIDAHDGFDFYGNCLQVRVLLSPELCMLQPNSARLIG